MKISFFILTLFSTFLSFAQNEVSTIYWGTSILDFRVSPFQVLSTNAVDSKESGTSICDSAGNLLFYSNGGTSPTAAGVVGGAWSADGQFLQDGQNLEQLGCFSTQQGAIILPDPAGITASNKKYYLLTKDCLEAAVSSNPIGHRGLSYGIIDMLANGGNGAVISQNNVVVPNTINGGGSTDWEPLNVVLDANSDLKSGIAGYWVYAYDGDSLYKIHFGVNGFDSFQKLFKEGGKIIVSPDGNHLMIRENLYSVDALTGDLQLTHSFQTTTHGAFSSDGRKIFRMENGKLMQYHLDMTNWQTSPYQVATFSQSTIPQFLLVPSGRIFLWQNNSGFSAQIMCPNSFGPDCNYIASAMSLQGGMLSTPPNIPAHYLYNTQSGCVLELSEEVSKKILLAPNPSAGSFKVYLGNLDQSDLTIRIIDLTGRIIRTNKSVDLMQDDQLEIHTEDLQNGEYFLELAPKDRETIVKRFVINQ